MKNEKKAYSKEYLAGVYNSGRSWLLGVLLFTVVNLFLLVLDTGRYFLISLSVPYYFTLMGLVSDATGKVGAVTTAALVISAVILGMYLLCWLKSKQRPGWLTAALVLFCLDTVGLLVLAQLDKSLLDLGFHGITIVYMARGIWAARKAKAQAAQETAARGTTPELD